MMLPRRSHKIDLPKRHSHRSAVPLVILPLAAATVGTYFFVINRTKVKHDGTLEAWRNRTSDLTPSWEASKPVPNMDVAASGSAAPPTGAMQVSPTEDIAKVEPLYDSGDKDMLDRRPSDMDAPVARDMPGDKALDLKAPAAKHVEPHRVEPEPATAIGPESSMVESMEAEIEATEADVSPDSSQFEPMIGKGVVDINGDSVGDVEAVYYRNLRMQPEWVAVTIGLIDHHRVLVPLDGYTDGERIEVPYPKDMIEHAPVIDARVLDEDVEMSLYAYYSARRILPGVESEKHPDAVKLRSWAPPETGRKEWTPS